MKVHKQTHKYVEPSPLPPHPDSHTLTHPNTFTLHPSNFKKKKSMIPEYTTNLLSLSHIKKVLDTLIHVTLQHRTHLLVITRFYLPLLSLPHDYSSSPSHSFLRIPQVHLPWSPNQYYLSLSLLLSLCPSPVLPLIQALVTPVPLSPKTSIQQSRFEVKQLLTVS